MGSWELTRWEVDVLRVDLVGVDFVRVDLVGLTPPKKQKHEESPIPSKIAKRVIESHEE